MILRDAHADDLPAIVAIYNALGDLPRVAELDAVERDLVILGRRLAE